MMQKLTLIYTVPVGFGSSAGMTITRMLYLEAPAKCTTNELMSAINEAGYKTQKPGYEWDIADAIVFLFYGHVESVR